MTIIRKILSRTEQAREARRQRRQEENALTQAIDQVVKTSAPAVCSLPDCRRDLRSPVKNALNYIQQAITTIPGPAALTPANWDQDPLLHALFVDAEEMKAFLATDRRLKAFFAGRPEPQAFALLTATKREHTIFGTAWEGDIAQRDVPQTAVEFHDHRIIEPFAAADETRQALRDRSLNALVTRVLERQLQRRSLKDELKEQQRILSIKLKIQQTRMHGLDNLKADEIDRRSARPAESQVLAEIERQLQDVGAESDCPQEYLRQLMAVLNAPQQTLTVRPVSLRLNWLGVKQGDTAAENGDAIRLAEIEFQDHVKRVALFVTIARQNCLKR